MKLCSSIYRQYSSFIYYRQPIQYSIKSFHVLNFNRSHFVTDNRFYNFTRIIFNINKIVESAKVNNDSHNDSAICLINVYYRVVLHLWELYLCLFLVLIALLQIADMYIDCKSICYCNMLNCIPNPYNYISLIDIIYIVYA